jgi:hypothetical protein
MVDEPHPAKLRELYESMTTADLELLRAAFVADHRTRPRLCGDFCTNRIALIDAVLAARSSPHADGT